MNKDQFIQNVIEWANARKIIQNGSLEGQRLKFIEEAGELAAAIARNNIDGIKDAIGDMCVVEVILSKVEKRPGPPLASAGWREPNWDNARIIQDAIEHMEVGFIDTLAYRYDFALEECWQAAWDAIKDRRGYMNEQGVFVKEEA